MSDLEGSTVAKESLYTRIGGRPAVEGAVKVFYDRVLADKRVSKYFANTDMRQLRRKLVRQARLYCDVTARTPSDTRILCKLAQAVFVVFAFGGPAEYTGQDLVAAHKPVIKKGASLYHFDIVVDHFMATLVELGVSKVLYAKWQSS